MTTAAPSPNLAPPPSVFIPPQTGPVISDASSGNIQVTYANILTVQLAQLFMDLFPISTDYQFEADLITDTQTLMGRQNQLIQDISQIKMTILVINQITTLAASRIPAGYNPGGPNADPSNIAGLSTSNNNNPVLNILNDLYIDITTDAYSAAQSDYARLRNQLRAYNPV